jgi:hypothetical protein
MFPLTKKLPESKEALIVILADKSASCYEYGRYKLVMQISTIFIFILNLINLNNM